MKFCRFLTGVSAALPSYGLLENGKVQAISGLPWAQWSKTPTALPLDAVRLLAPVEPTKVVCIGRNYAAHAAELGNEVPKEPLMFLKPPSSIIGPEEPIILPKISQRVEHEAELGMVMSRRCSQLTDTDDPLSYVLGYTCLNDVTARDLQKGDVQFTRAKGFDSFCPVGPHIETELDPANVLVECFVNGERRQSGSTALMIYPPAFLVRWISRMMTLLPGDIIATGTPSGVGPLAAGTVAEVQVAGIGVLRNPVHAANV
ncbi:MAG TPA: fumarylacetoacetate hydrolase family protein [Candidatus Saccharimonadales bacterium]|nr:fumarylacetoacetate hydrolase family protein [Candidatus Saccharimonadales bacterium]